MTDTPYARWLGTDNDLCVPVIDRAGLDAIFQKAAVQVYQALGQGPMPKTYLDLEHVQVADYGAFEGVSDQQRQSIGSLHVQAPIRPEEMIFLGLRSLCQFAWPKPESEDDIRFAAAFDHVLNRVLTHTALDSHRVTPTPAGGGG